MHVNDDEVATSDASKGIQTPNSKALEKVVDKADNPINDVE